MPKPKTAVLSVKIPPALNKELRRRALSNGVTVSTYLAALLTEHAAGPPLIGVAARPSGLTAASEKTRKRVSRAGVNGRGNKETDRG